MIEQTIREQYTIGDVFDPCRLYRDFALKQISLPSALIPSLISNHLGSCEACQTFATTATKWIGPTQGGNQLSFYQ